MASRVAFPGTINSGDSVSASDNNKLPGGEIGRSTITANSSGTTTTETITSVVVTVGANREIEVRVTGTLRATGAGGVSVRVTEDGTQIGRKNGYVQGSAQDFPFEFTFISVAPSAGS